jgi:hypothetical protein
MMHGPMNVKDFSLIQCAWIGTGAHTACFLVDMGNGRLMKITTFAKQRRDQEWGALQLHSPAFLYVMHKGFAYTWKEWIVFSFVSPHKVNSVV